MAIILDQSGALQGVRFGDVSFLDGGTQATWIIWVNIDTDSSDSNANVWRKDGAWTPLQRNGAGSNYRSVLWIPALTTTPNALQPDVGEWHFCAVVVDRTLATERYRFWTAQEGAVSLTVSAVHDLNGTFTFVNSSPQMRMGSNDSEDGELLAGQLRQAAILDIPLSEGQLTDIFNDWDQVLTHGANLVFAAPLDFDARDISGGGNDGTTFGNPTFTESPPSGAGTAAFSLGLDLDATGSRPSAGTGALALGLDLDAVGSRTSAGTAPLALGLDLDAAGARASGGTAELGLGLDLDSTGTRASAGTAELGLGLDLDAAGSEAPAGTVELALGFELAAAGTRSSSGTAAFDLGFELDARSIQQGVETPPERIFTVRAEDRTLNVDDDPRVLAVRAEKRVYHAR